MKQSKVECQINEMQDLDWLNIQNICMCYAMIHISKWGAIKIYNSLSIW